MRQSHLPIALVAATSTGKLPRIVFATAVAAFLACGVLSSTAPAAEAAARLSFEQQDRHISRFCYKYRGGDQCNDWRANHTTWTSDQYLNFYRLHQDDKEFATPAAAKLFGFEPAQK